MAKSSGTLGAASRAFSGLGISSRLLARHGALRPATQQASEEPQQPRLPPLPGKGCPSPAPSWCSQRSPSRGRAALAGGRDRPAGSPALGASCLPSSHASLLRRGHRVSPSHQIFCPFRLSSAVDPSASSRAGVFSDCLSPCTNKHVSSRSGVTQFLHIGLKEGNPRKAPFVTWALYSLGGEQIRTPSLGRRSLKCLGRWRDQRSVRLGGCRSPCIWLTPRPGWRRAWLASGTHTHDCRWPLARTRGPSPKNKAPGPVAAALRHMTFPILVWRSLGVRLPPPPVTPGLVLSFYFFLNNSTMEV